MTTRRHTAKLPLLTRAAHFEAALYHIARLLHLTEKDKRVFPLVSNAQDCLTEAQWRDRQKRRGK